MYNLEESEVVLKIVRRHWFIMLGEVVGVLLAIVTPLALLFFIDKYTTETIEVLTNTYLILFVYALWILVVIIQAAFAWTNYYFDMWIITSKRIIHVEQKAMFSRVMSSFRLERIQDVTVDIHGLFHTVFDFGDIQVQTAGAERKFILETAPNPNELRDFILKLHTQKMGEA